MPKQSDMPLPEPMSDEEIRKAVIAALAGWASDEEWRNFTRESGPYQITVPRFSTEKVARAICAARDAQWQSLLDAAIAAERERCAKLLRDPASVHVALLRGEIAKPPLRSTLHAYGAATLDAWDWAEAVANHDHTYFGADAVTDNPDGLYFKVKKLRAAIDASRKERT